MAKKATYEEVKARFESNGLELLETEYINSKTPMKYICKYHKNEIQHKTFNELKQSGCRKCGYDAVSEKRSDNFEKIEKAFSDVGLILLEQKRRGKNIKLKCICPKHNGIVLEMTYSNVSRGHGCKYCANEIKSQKYKGENSSYYKGGISPLNIVLREELKSWRFKVLQKHKFKCCITGMNMNEARIDVHHVRSFHEIRDEILNEMGYKAKFRRKTWKVSELTEKEIDYIKSEIVKRHKIEDGFPITKELHREFHNLYGMKATFEDFLEFKEKMKSTQTGSVLDED